MCRAGAHHASNNPRLKPVRRYAACGEFAKQLLDGAIYVAHGMTVAVRSLRHQGMAHRSALRDRIVERHSDARAQRRVHEHFLAGNQDLADVQSAYG